MTNSLEEKVEVEIKKLPKKSHLQLHLSLKVLNLRDLTYPPPKTKMTKLVSEQLGIKSLLI
jgi:hypothetical protein